MEATLKDKLDRAVLAIAPTVLGLNEKGTAAVAEQGLAYLSADELNKLRVIVFAVQRELSN